jgi:hypothetical protein
VNQRVAVLMRPPHLVQDPRHRVVDVLAAAAAPVHIAGECGACCGGAWSSSTLESLQDVDRPAPEVEQPLYEQRVFNVVDKPRLTFERDAGMMPEQLCADSAAIARGLRLLMNRTADLVGPDAPAPRRRLRLCIGLEGV